MTETAAKPEPLTITLPELIKAIKANNPESLGKMNEARALLVSRALLGELKKRLEATPQGGTLNVKGLGRFALKQHTAEVNGRTVVRRSAHLRLDPPAPSAQTDGVSTTE